MRRKAFFNIASSSLIVATTMVGCSGAALDDRAGASAGKLEEMAASQALIAEKALADRDAGRAIQIAEAAVAGDPRDASYRTLLGRAYLLGGRFDSARTAFEDALTLGSTDARTIVNLSLIHVAQGHSAAAQDLLTSNIARLSAADYGLAMAMAGNPDEAIRVLSQAIHAPNAGSKERQNLAYSYALAGRWTEARQMAAFDLAPLDAAKRVMGWAQMAQPGAESTRVIAMIGVTPRTDDTGLPVRLALAPIPASSVLAAIGPASTAADNFSDPAEIAYDEPIDAAPLKAPVKQVAQAPVNAPPAQAPAPVVHAPLSPLMRTATPLMKTDIPAARPVPMLKVKIPAARPAAVWRPVDVAKASQWVVQLGAFPTAQLAKDGWSLFLRRNEKLGAFPLVNSEAVVNGQRVHRVALAGFSDRAGAVRLCGAIRARGSDCFVRQGGPEATPSRWTKADQSRLLAMR